MNIGMILGEYFPEDIRVSKEAKSLINAGFNVSLLCLRRKGEKYNDVIKGIKVRRIDAGKNNVQQTLWSSFYFIWNSASYFQKEAKKFITDNELRVLHVHDLPLFKTALYYRNKYKLKIVLDLHENYPEAIKIWFKWRKNIGIKLKNKILYNYDKWLKYEEYAIDKADYVITVVEEMTERLKIKHSVKCNNFTVISNKEEKAFAEQVLIKDIYKDVKDKFIITYTGGIAPHRGVEVAIEGMKYINNDEIVLAIVGGSNKDNLIKLNKIIVENNLKSKVCYLGKQPFSKVFSYMKMASVNIVPHNKNEQTNNSMPHKLYQGMMTGNPVLVSDTKPLQRVVKKLGSGLVFKTGDPQSFAKKIMKLYDNKELKEELGRNGFNKTVKENENWETEGEKLVSLYQKIISK